MSYLDQFSTKRTPQTDPVPGSVANSAGGQSFTVDKWTQLRRFLILGAEGGTYYTGERKLVRDNAQSVLACIAEDGPHVVGEVQVISHEGRAPKNDPALFVLAMCLCDERVDTRRAAGAAVNSVARTSTHLFHLARYVELFGGWGSGKRKAFSRFYLDNDVEFVAYQAVKYRQRDGYTHRDILRLAHPKTTDPDRRRLFDWICRGTVTYDEMEVQLPRVIEGYLLVQECSTAADAARFVAQYELPWEAVPTDFLNSTDVWDALLGRIPLNALIRNLPRLTRLGMLDDLSGWTAPVTKRLTDPDALKGARVHPLNQLVALKTYQQGHGECGSSVWTPSRRIADALDESFYASFGAVEPIGRPVMLALDVSGSMGNPVAGLPVSCREASAAMALVTANVEKQYAIHGFTSTHGGYSIRTAGTSYHELDISPRQRLDDVVRRIEQLPFGGTDCSLPMRYATKHDLAVDAFFVYTDSETWAGVEHPFQSLRAYRERSGRNARLAVVGLNANPFSIAHPSDPGMLDVVGFDTAAPNLLSAFARGDV